MRHAIVTGGGRGLGAAVARELASANCAVILNFHSDPGSAEKVRAAIEQNGGKAQAIQADMADPDQVLRLVEDARRALGAVTVLVCNAGVGRPANVFDSPLEEFDATFAINVRGAFVATQAVLPDMREAGFGRLIFLSSLAAKTGGMISAPYAASKAALCTTMRPRLDSSVLRPMRSRRRSSRPT